MGFRLFAVENIHGGIQAALQAEHHGICRSQNHLLDLRPLFFTKTSQDMPGEFLTTRSSIRRRYTKFQAGELIRAKVLLERAKAIVPARRTRESQAQGAHGEIDVINDGEGFPGRYFVKTRHCGRGFPARIHVGLWFDQPGIA